MKNKRLAALLLGAVIAFGMCTTGCAGGEAGEGSTGADAGQGSAGQGGAEQGSTGQGGTEQGSTGQGSAEQGAAGQEGTEQGAGNTGAETEPQEDENPFSNLNEFQALALDGSTITQDDFSDKDITVINFWALSCGPCLAEMPDLAALEKALPENIQLMTVCLDGGGNEEYVEYVLDQSGFEGTTLLSGEGDLLALCQELQYTPTTVLVDSEGNTVGEAIIGGKENLAEFYTACINSALTDMGKDEISIGTESEAE